MMLVLVSALSSIIAFTHVFTRANMTAQQRDKMHRTLSADLEERRSWAAYTERESLITAFLLRRAGSTATQGKQV